MDKLKWATLYIVSYSYTFSHKNNLFLWIDTSSQVEQYFDVYEYIVFVGNVNSQFIVITSVVYRIWMIIVHSDRARDLEVSFHLLKISRANSFVAKSERAPTIARYPRGTVDKNIHSPIRAYGTFYFRSTVFHVAGAYTLSYRGYNSPLDKSRAVTLS